MRFIAFAAALASCSAVDTEPPARLIPLITISETGDEAVPDYGNCLILPTREATMQDCLAYITRHESLTCMYEFREDSNLAPMLPEGIRCNNWRTHEHR